MRDRYENVRATGDLSPCEKSQLLADKWRHERNFWLSALTLTLWIVLNRFYQMNVQLTELRDRIDNGPPDAPADAEETKKTS